MKSLKKSVCLSTLVLVTLLGFSASALSEKPYKLPPANTKVDVGPNTELLKKLSKGIGDIAASSKKALVYVSVSKTVKGFQGMDPLDLFGFGRRQIPAPKQEGLGSGFIIDLEKGYILTNNHVIDGADEINLKLDNGNIYKGKVMGHDPNTDIAVVQIADKKYSRKGLSALVLGDSDKLHVGAFVVALGAPFGLEASISFGTISALGRGSLQITQMGDFIQTDAAINPGNSGGPLVDMDGKVVGINTAIFSKSGGYNGIGFAVPAILVRRIANNLINNGKVSRGYIGVHFQPLSKDIKTSLGLPKKTKGVIVAQVEKGGPASQAGVVPWDIITAIDGNGIEDGRDLVSRIGLKSPGSKIKLSILRDKKDRKLTLTIGTYPGSEQVASKVGDKDSDTLGLSFTFKDGGLVVASIKKKSSAIGRLLPGDVVLSVDKTDFKGVKNLSAALSRFRNAIKQARKNKQKSVIMRIQGGEQRNSQGFAFVTIDLD